MKTFPSPSKPATLRDSFHQHLHLYALAASAAGVSVLAMVQPGEAEIVYTPVHHTITPNHTFLLDLTGDGTSDFKIHDSFSCTSFCEDILGAITVKPAQAGNEVWGYAEGSHSFASALKPGVLIGSMGKFSPNRKVMASGGYDAGTTTRGFCTGPWKNERGHYLGLKFMISGEVHYGWARLSESCARNGENSAVLTGYAYETIPNLGIRAGRTKGKNDDDDGVIGSLAPTPGSAPAPAPATLGLLAKGAPAFCIWRREQDLLSNEMSCSGLPRRVSELKK